MSRRVSIFYFVLLLFFRSLALFSLVTGDLAGDRQALLDFLNNITHPRSLAWNASSSACTTWPGVTCDRDGTRVTALHLPGASLLGVIPPGTISRLSELQILSLRSNGLQGPFPIDFLQLKKLKAVSLSNNKFSGPLPSDYATWTNLTVLDLYGNRFNGRIPAGLANLTGLISLNLAENSLSGEIPDLSLPGLSRLNFASNNLTGSIPKSLQRFGNSSFSGNNLSYENAPPPVVSPKEKNRIYISKPAILGIAVIGCFVIFFVIAVLMIVCYMKKQRRQETEIEKLNPARKLPSEKEVSKLGKEKNIEDMEDKIEVNRVMFFEGSNMAFNFEDLLKTSAEFLGKGTFGMTYKAVLEDSKVVAVKRLKDMVVSRKDFKHQMEIVGNIRHKNVAPLRAYVCSKEEKLMVYDYYPKGSLYLLLHGKDGDEGHVPLNWEKRLRFMIGVAKGLGHIHTHKLAHGNIKSSNVFMNSKGYGCISEAGLAVVTNPVMMKEDSSTKRVLSYRAPEATDTRRSTPESDVYGFGILMLETLTGKTSVNDENEEIDLKAWVNSVLNGQWTGEVFDSKLEKTPNIEAKLIQMLKLGLSCTERTLVRRPEMVKVIEILKEIEREFKREIKVQKP